jgi:hypothetical protein
MSNKDTDILSACSNITGIPKEFISDIHQHGCGHYSFFAFGIAIYIGYDKQGHWVLNVPKQEIVRLD